MTLSVKTLCANLPRHSHQGWAEVRGVSSDFPAYDATFEGPDDPPKKPSPLFLYLGLSSVILGLILGVFGVFTRATASGSQQFLIGGVGYLLTAFIPIVFLQLIRHSHTSALAVNQDEPYDIYAGITLQKNFLKVVGFGLIAASLSIFVFFWPIAEGFAS
jgi:hypothetical protein